jgi:caffeoyl-CoA O-methyltransferase
LFIAYCPLQIAYCLLQIANCILKNQIVDIINPLIQSYAEQFSSPEDPLLKQIADYTRANHPEHHMLSGQLQGKFLEMISRMIRPRRILEIGTFTGYSAICLAKGLAEDGELHTIELREQDAARAREFFNASLTGRIILHTGNALEVIPALKETWDLVFIDADKVSYIEYFTLVLPKVRQNGYILADNVFFHGQVLSDEAKNKSARAIKEFNTFVSERQDIDKLIITLRDGLYLIRKL